MLVNAGGLVVAQTGFGVEKKSISLPTVNGMDIDTVDETKSKPTAMDSGFRSGFARATILRNEEVVSDDEEGNIRDTMEGFWGDSLGCVVYSRVVSNVGLKCHVGWENCRMDRGRRAAASTAGVRKDSARNEPRHGESIVQRRCRRTSEST